MYISTTAAQLAAQNFAAGTNHGVRPQPPKMAPRRIETADLVDLTSKPQQAAKAPAAKPAEPTHDARAPSPPAAGGAARHDAAFIRSDARPPRPGSQLDIRV